MNENTDTIDRLRRMNPTNGTVSEDMVQQDLARGRAAAAHAHRKQAWVAGGVGGFALAVIVAGGAILPSLHAGTAPQAGSADTTVGHQITAEPAMRLVSYTGTQPDGYHLGKIPAGFTVETSDQHNLILAPTGTPAASTSDGMVDYTGKVVISQQGSFTYTKDKREVTINAKPALIAQANGPDGATEVQFVTDGHTVNIQVWNTIKLTDQQIIDFAQNITVTGNPTTFGG
jgi:hypothetical protein